VKRFALALSHLPSTVCGNDLPIVSTVNAIDSIGRFGGVLVSSLGAVHWDVQVVAAIRAGIPFELILEETIDQELYASIIAHSFSVRWVSTCEERDRVVLGSAQIIFPIWCRSAGMMNRILATLPNSKIYRSFEIKFVSHTKHKVDLPQNMSDECLDLPENYLWHWTRKSQKLWPNESPEQFTNDLLDSTRDPRSALATLQRILSMKTILANSSAIGGSVPVVCFTENHPRSMNNHFYWRTGRHRMNFEPYAIGFPKDLIIQHGGVALQYGGKATWESMEKSDRWISEREWRVRDNFFFEELTESMIIIVKTTNDCCVLSDFQAIPYFEL